ncbi:MULTISPECIES: hypothetical protein [Caulobacter]|jgi:hypothetical protein|uniref:Uncharacterized protein n=1 Tax=Caulobacter vibrioides OR37 TaxID=1292034 RepID=R0ER93_CAUVI|nr:MULTISPECIES: hypothetical protein [Caulobacter]ENZ83537.1 hypothetical protein OR37_00038 [Caulobacter vibrioides OR37]MBQ1561432.1 hypothetical protein [Caulobacter sp.]
MTLDLFRQDAWMLMPISWFVFVNVQVWLKDAARRDAIEALNALTRAGRRPPAELVAKLQVG